MTSLQKIILPILFFSAASCSPLGPKGEGSVLIIALSGFRADDLGCGSAAGSATPRLDEICQESVRFSHAYTTSVLTNAAMTSLLTGLYPVEHGVRRNGASRYSEGVTSLAQVARGQGYTTMLVSGGPPVLRKSAVSQGFDIFDDSVRVNDSFYRPASEVVRRFISHFDGATPGAPLFSLLYFADLEFGEFGSFSGIHSAEEGPVRLQDVDRAVGDLRGFLKKNKLWDSLTVVVVGLQGAERLEHGALSRGVSLFDEVVRVPVLIKPARKPRDLGPTWKIDPPVSIADVGHTLAQKIGSRGLKASQLGVVDLTEVLEGADFETSDRPIFVESDLPVWRDWGPLLVSMRVGEWVLWSEGHLFNTYTDRLELNDVYSRENNMRKQLEASWSKYKPLFFADPVKADRRMPLSVSEKLRVAKIVFSPYVTIQEKMRELSDLELRRPDDWQIVQWHVNLLFDNRLWPEAFRMLKAKKPKLLDRVRELQLWRSVLSIYIKNVDHDRRDQSDNCLVSFGNFLTRKHSANDVRHLPRVCDDSEIRLWLTAFLQLKTGQAKDAATTLEFARTLSQRRMEQEKLGEIFWYNGATWDYLESLPSGPSVLEMATHYLPLSEFAGFVKQKLGSR